jgi:L-asparaginase II
MYPRSALKPVQALAMRESGLDLQGALAVITMASHQGTDDHVQLVGSVLESQDLSAEALQCPRAFAGNPASRAKDNQMSRLKMNCSGKHAGFLATCVMNGWETNNYLDPNHPLQQKMLQTVQRLTSEKVSHTTADGCGAPLFAISTTGLAKATSGFMREGAQLVEAAKANPWVIGDHGSPDAVFLEHGLMAKIGAEGVFVVGLEDGHALAIKIADGQLRAAPVIAAELLNKLGLITDEVCKNIVARVEPKVTGGDLITGKLKVII